MTYYELYVTDDNGNTSSWSHTNGHRGKPCMVFADDVDQTIVLQHSSMTTYIYISAAGVLDIHTEKVQPPVETPAASKRARRRKRPKRRRS